MKYTLYYIDFTQKPVYSECREIADKKFGIFKKRLDFLSAVIYNRRAFDCRHGELSELVEGARLEIV